MTSGCTHIELHMELRTRWSCMNGLSRVHNCKENVPLATYTTLHIGGTARYMCSVTSEQELHDAVLFAQENSKPFFVIGGGSNILVPDTGYDGVVIHMCMKGIVYEKEKDGEVLVVCAGGEEWDACVAGTVLHGLSGLENLSGIPGSVGASPVQNIGAYGVEVGNHIAYVEVFDTQTHTTKKLLQEECRFGYRDSIFKSRDGKKYIVTQVAFTLSTIFTPSLTYKDVSLFFLEKKSTPHTSLDIRNAVLHIRAQKFPDMHIFGTAGSFFKNPFMTRSAYTHILQKYPDIPHFPIDTTRVKVPLAWILDSVCHLKGFTEGNVFLFEQQPLVLVTQHGATARNVLACAQHVEEIVFEKTGIHIEREVVLME